MQTQDRADFSLSPLLLRTQHQCAEVENYLKQRKLFLAASSEAMDRPRGQVDLILSHNARNEPEHRFSTREVIAGILLQLPLQIQELWKEARDAGPGEENQLRKVFCWSFKSLINVNSDQGVTIKNRSAGMPYAVHTHVDVPLAISAILNSVHARNCAVPDPLTLAVACSHDTKEEGHFIKWDQETSCPLVCDLNEKQLLAQFPAEQLGRRLMISIPTLTESTYEQMKEHCDVDGLSDRAARILSACQDKPFSEDDTPWFRKFLVIHPLVFGGLASQVKLMIESLLLDEPADEPLAYSIAMTEIADRVSDAASMEYYFNYTSEFGATAAHQRVLCFFSRINNVVQKIEKTLPLFTDEKHRQEIKHGLSFLETLALYKLHQLGEMFPEEPFAQFNDEEIGAHSQMMQQVQAAADNCMEDFIGAKVARIRVEASLP